MSISALTNNYSIIDIGDILDEHRHRTSLLKLFKYLPVEAIVEIVLSLCHYVDYSESIFNELDKRLSELNTDEIDIDLDQVELYIELLTQEIDDRIVKKVSLKEGQFYLFEKWLGKSSIVLGIIDD